jgi:hypothetical protein
MYGTYILYIKAPDILCTFHAGYTPLLHTVTTQLTGIYACGLLPVHRAVNF